jgi:hypothetical protein
MKKPAYITLRVIHTTVKEEAKVFVPDIDFAEYRVKFTDHFPVIINIKVHMDNN